MTNSENNPIAQFWKKNRYIIIASVAVIIVFLIFIHYLWRAGWLTLTGTESNTTIVAASIALVGALFGSIVSLLGLALKHSVDERNLALQERNETLAKEAEQRLTNEAAIQSIGLLSTSAGGETSQTQQAGVILALANLNKFTIALSLADQMINDTAKPLNTGTFCWLINKAITDGEDDIKLQAVLSLSQHIDKLPKPDGTPFFAVALMDIKKYPEFSIAIRQRAIQILIDLLTLRPLAEWRASNVRNITNTLYRMYNIESDTTTKNFTGTMLFQILHVRDGDEVISYNNESKKVNAIIETLSKYKESTSNSTSFVNGKNRLEIVKKWRQENS